MVVRDFRERLVLICLLGVMLSGCNRRPSGPDNLLAQLINLPNRSAAVDSFRLDRATQVQVQAVGEILFNMSDPVKNSYYLKSDGIDLYCWSLEKDSSDKGDSTATRSYFNFSMANDKEQWKRLGIKIKWLQEKGYYIGEIAIPWTALNGITADAGKQIGCRIVAGDNDNHFFQEATIQWDGVLKLNKTTRSSAADRITCTAGTRWVWNVPFHSVKIDAQKEEAWSSAPRHILDSITYGFVKDSFDLTASVNVLWDTANLYWWIAVTDDQLRRVFPHRRAEYDILLDYGYITDAKGKLIWKMRAENSIHAGGAFKNQKADTVLKLPAGKYFVHFRTDESHAAGDWDDAPPLTDYQGIKVFQVR